MAVLRNTLLALAALTLLAGCGAGGGGVIEPESKTKGSGTSSPMDHAPKLLNDNTLSI